MLKQLGTYVQSLIKNEGSLRTSEDTVKRYRFYLMSLITFQSTLIHSKINRHFRTAVFDPDLHKEWSKLIEALTEELEITQTLASY